jgi:hypothetical protein
VKRLEVEFFNASCAYIRGYGARELVTERTGRPPVWATLSRAWVCQPATARDVIAIAEMRGYDVLVSDGEVADPGAGRW